MVVGVWSDIADFFSLSECLSGTRFLDDYIIMRSVIKITEKKNILSFKKFIAINQYLLNVPRARVTNNKLYQDLKLRKLHFAQSGCSLETVDTNDGFKLYGLSCFKGVYKNIEDVLSEKHKQKYSIPCYEGAKEAMRFVGSIRTLIGFAIRYYEDKIKNDYNFYPRSRDFYAGSGLCFCISMTYYPSAPKCFEDKQDYFYKSLYGLYIEMFNDADRIIAEHDAYLQKIRQEIYDTELQEIRDNEKSIAEENVNQRLQSAREYVKKKEKEKYDEEIRKYKSQQKKIIEQQTKETERLRIEFEKQYRNQYVNETRKTRVENRVLKEENQDLRRKIKQLIDKSALLKEQYKLPAANETDKKLDAVLEFLSTMQTGNLSDIPMSDLEGMFKKMRGK